MFENRNSARRRRRLVPFMLAALLTATMGSQARAWKLAYFEIEGRGFCHITAEEPDGSRIAFMTMKVADQTIGVSIANPKWSYIDDELYPDVELGTEEGSFGKLTAQGNGHGLVIMIPRSKFDDFAEHGAKDDLDIGLVKDGKVLARFSMLHLREKYDQLVACDTIKFRDSTSIAKDPFK